MKIETAEAEIVHCPYCGQYAMHLARCKLSAMHTGKALVVVAVQVPRESDDE